MKKLIKTNEEWKRILTDIQFRILRERGTEAAFHSPIYYNNEGGNYHCIACDNLLFKSEDKYESGTGWPSFTKPSGKNSVNYDPNSVKIRTGSEVICKRCEGHLGHVFDDGPKPLGLRFCINGETLKFKKEK
jgi:peptide-methionine (R)-S-oxide reductase